MFDSDPDGPKCVGTGIAIVLVRVSGRSSCLGRGGGSKGAAVAGAVLGRRDKVVGGDGRPSSDSGGGSAGNVGRRDSVDADGGRGGGKGGAATVGRPVIAGGADGSGGRGGGAGSGRPTDENDEPVADL